MADHLLDTTLYACPSTFKTAPPLFVLNLEGLEAMSTQIADNGQIVPLLLGRLQEFYDSCFASQTGYRLVIIAATDSGYLGGIPSRPARLLGWVGRFKAIPYE